eukprot:scaffold16815_cov107-Skeletonema_marinoi.AAC.1
MDSSIRAWNEQLSNETAISSRGSHLCPSLLPTLAAAGYRLAVCFWINAVAMALPFCLYAC